MKKFTYLVLFFTMFISQTFSGTCVMSVTRVSCPEKERDCYSKCNGKETCDETKKVGSISACSKEATRNCVVFREGVTKSKKITATFDGKPVENGKNFCEPVKNEYNFNTCK